MCKPKMYHYIGQILYYEATIGNPEKVHEYLKVVGLTKEGIKYCRWDKRNKKWMEHQPVLSYNCEGYMKAIRREATYMECLLYVENT